ncbi:MAG: MotA/TolQ/ExbB proton channel family protein [Gammaproteobacteria bacterium]|nr:MotA/TolQ/ExbB proton channel family protein [Gammaproteobacteria bacterium]NND59832.1 MotA/TolQ/ExbB proton channel family protein [Gammaproteobacteria bacterium]
MKNLIKLVLIAALVVTPVMAQQSVSVDDLLQKVRQGRTADNQVNQERIREFQAQRAQQQQLLTQAKGQREAGERRSAELEAAFDVNDQELIQLEAQLQERLGELKELFGVLQQAAGDALGQFEGSLTQIQYPQRDEFLVEFAQKMGQTNRLASLEEIEQIWFELYREMVESGKVVTFPTEVVTSEGNVTKDITRVGLFNIVADGKYLNYIPETDKVIELPRQPQGRFTSKAADLSDADTGMHPFGMDPTRGQILSLKVESPNIRERIDQGGVIGYIIIGLGVIAILIAIWRMIALTTIGAQVRAQQKNLENPGNNPLGRVLAVYQENRNADVETLELKLGEAILKESPKLQSMLTFLKIIAVVAPLMGLLGTVTGMIITFQQITLFGTGDPKLMAGGISQALMTTVLGLCVAIPTVFLHTFVASRAKSVSQIIQEQAAGMVARQAESHVDRAA